MSAILPPEQMQMDHGDEEPRRPIIVMTRPPQQTFTQFCQNLALKFAILLAFLALAALIVTFTWNSLESVHHLTTLEWRETFAGLILLRVLALVAHT